MMRAKARIAVIGAGWWSTYAHIPALQANPAAELVAVCDTNPDKLAAAARAYNLEQTYADFRTMLADARPDGVVVATSHATHYPIARYALEHGVHVMLEKPMTLRAQDAHELVIAARRAQRELIIGYPYNFEAQVIRARDVLRSGVLGPVQYMSGVMVSRVIEFLRGDSQPAYGSGIFPVHGPGAVYSQPELSGGGHGHLQLTHLAGLLFFVTDLRARRVLGLMHTQGLAVDLVDALVVEFEGGALGMLGGSGNAYGGTVALQVHCAHGSVEIDILAGRTTVRDADGRHEVVERTDDDQAHGPFVTAGNLVDVVRGAAANGSPGESGWRAVEVLDAAYRSAAQGGAAVTIESLYA